MTEYCPVCEALTEIVTPEALAMVSGVSERSIFRLIEAGEVHFTDGPTVYVCVNSLKEFKRRSNRRRILEEIKL